MTVPANRFIIASYSDLGVSPSGAPQVGIGLYYYGSPGAQIGAGYTLDIIYRGAGGAPVTLPTPIYSELSAGTEYIIIESTWYDYFDVVPASSYFNDEVMISAGDSKPDVIALVLKKGGVVVDTLGNPGTGTPLLDGPGIVVRNTNFEDPGTGYLASDWNVLATNDPSLGNNPYKYVNGFTGAVAPAAPPADTISPTVISIVTTGTAGPTNADTITYTVTFSEDVTGVSADDFTLTATGNASGQVTQVTMVGPSAYAVTVSNVTGNGTLRLDLNGSGTGIADTHGNAITGGYTAGQTYTVDTTAPTLSITSDRSVLKAGESATITFTFSEDPGSSFTSDDVMVGGGTLGPMSGSGLTRTATFTPSANTDNGTASVTVAAGKYTDAAGNAGGAGASPSITFDTKAPTVAVESATFSDDTGASGADMITSSANQTISGTLGSSLGTGERVEVSLDNGASWDVATVDGVTWSFAAVLSGSGTLQVRVMDTAGNTGPVYAHSYVIDTVAPSAPSAPDLAAASDTGISNTDNITGATTPTFTGTAEIGATVRLYDGVTEIGSAVATDGTWSITSSTLGAGAHTITAVATDAAGNVGLASPPLEIQVVTEGPATQVTGMALSDDSGVSATDFVTRTAVQTLAGTLSAALAAGERVEVSFDDGGTWTPALSETPTSWSLAAVLTEGTHTIAVRVVDAIGNTGPVRSQAYTLDTVAPGLTITSNLAALKAHETATITFTFSEDPGASFTLDAISVVGGTLGALSGTGLTRTAVFTPEPGVSGGTATIAVTAGTYTDAAGNAGGAGAPLALALDTRAPLVDGVAVDRTETTNLDGSVSQVVTIPVVTAGRSETDGSALYADIPLVTAGGRPVLTVQVGVGLGLTASGFAAPKAAGASLADLIREIQAHAGAADRTTLSGGGAGFLAGLPAHTPLLVQALTLTQAGAVAGVPLVISGDSSAQAPATALVIDARGLSAGTVIALDNVAFATILGAVRVTGGAGSQVVYGDGAAQHIVLGADDDTLHGGGGNDYIGSKGGNDWLYGDAGNDTVAGGIGDDHLYGGTGHDRLLGEAGHDRLEGGSGNDTLLGGSGHDTLAGGTGHDRLYGDAGNDRLYGGSGHDRLDGGSGHDRLDGGAGNDTLLGGTGNDTLVGGLGRDQLWGGAGRDVFVFTTVAESRVGAQRDVIHDFQSGHDRIDLRGIDANTRLAGNQAFSWTGADGPFLHPQESAAFLATGFTGRAGELRFANGLLMGDVDGDGRADFEIRIVGPLAAGDVIL
ncbi:Ig-like domain-containing protein [Microvirga sp. M2]|uniref:Ig-like domain-containing protein n=1 Tax=Microvirga sp. M2 TaxID=3073270 RepID=UPI0039C39FD6